MIINKNHSNLESLIYQNISYTVYRLPSLKIIVSIVIFFLKRELDMLLINCELKVILSHFVMKFSENKKIWISNYSSSTALFSKKFYFRLHMTDVRINLDAIFVKQVNLWYWISYVMNAGQLKIKKIKKTIWIIYLYDTILAIIIRM